MKTPVASRTSSDRSCDSARRRDDAPPVGGDGERRAEAKTPTAAPSLTTRSHERADLDSARGRRGKTRSEVLSPVGVARETTKTTAAHRAGPALVDAPPEIDGSRIVDKFIDIKDIQDEGLKSAHAAYLEHNVLRLKELLPELPYSDTQVSFFLAKQCRGIILLHYPPFSECGSHTNLALNVHERATAKDPEGRTIFKLKSSCMLLNCYAIAEWLPEFQDKDECRPIRVVDDARPGQEILINVSSRSIAALDWDHFELFPTFTRNDIDIRKALAEKRGTRLANDFMKEAGRRYAALALARRRQVIKHTGSEPPLFLWNAGKTEVNMPYGGAQIDVSNALQSARDEGYVFSCYHPAFLMRFSATAKLAAKHADAAAKGFAAGIVGAPAAVTPVAPARATAATDASTDDDTADAASLAPPSTAPSTRSAGFWVRFLGVGDMTDEEIREEMLEHLASMREKWERMRAAVELVERLEAEDRKPSKEQAAAAAEAADSVERWRHRIDKWERMRAAVELVERLEAEDLNPDAEMQMAYKAAFPSVNALRLGQKAGRATQADQREIVREVEKMRADGIEPNAKLRVSYDAAFPSVNVQRLALKAGRATQADQREIVREVEKMRADGIEPNAKLRVSYDAARATHNKRVRGLKAHDAARREAAGVPLSTADAITQVLRSAGGRLWTLQIREKIKGLASDKYGTNVARTLRRNADRPERPGKWKLVEKRGWQGFWELIARESPPDVSATDCGAAAPVAPPGVAAGGGMGSVASAAETPFAAAAAVRDPGAARTDAVARVATGGAFAASYAKVVRDDPPAAASVRAAVRVSAVAAAPSGAARSSGASASASAGGRSHSAVVKRAGGRGARQLDKRIEEMTVKELWAALEYRNVPFSKRNDKQKQLQEMLREEVKKERGGNPFFNFFKKG